MDEQVVNDVKTIFGDLDPSLPYILMRIVEGSKGKLDAKYKKPGNVDALMKEHVPDLTEKLQVAWNKRSFRDIQRLRFSSQTK